MVFGNLSTGIEVFGAYNSDDQTYTPDRTYTLVDTIEAKGVSNIYYYGLYKVEFQNEGEPEWRIHGESSSLTDSDYTFEQDGNELVITSKNAGTAGAFTMTAAAIHKAADEGTQVHEAAEKLVLGEEISWMDDYGNAKYSQIVWEMILKFAEFWKEYKPELISSEQFVWSDKYKYAGTADIVCKMNDEIWLLDLKTSNSIHKSYDLQLASYAKGLEESRGVKIERTGIIWLKAKCRGPSKQKGVIQGKGWKVLQIDEIEKNFKLFQNIYELYQLENPNTEPIYNSYPTTIKV